LRAERRHILGLGLPFGAVAGETRRKFLSQTGGGARERAGKQCHKECGGFAGAPHNSFA
jgi:hypothetical protein